MRQYKILLYGSQKVDFIKPDDENSKIRRILPKAVGIDFTKHQSDQAEVSFVDIRDFGTRDYSMLKHFLSLEHHLGKPIVLLFPKDEKELQQLHDQLQKSASVQKPPTLVLTGTSGCNPIIVDTTSIERFAKAIIDQSYVKDNSQVSNSYAQNTSQVSNLIKSITNLIGSVRPGANDPHDEEEGKSSSPSFNG